MPRGRMAWRAPRFTTNTALLPPLRRIHDPPIRPFGPAVGQRRCFQPEPRPLEPMPIEPSPVRAAVEPSLLRSTPFASWFPDSTAVGDGVGDGSALENLLRAIQCQDRGRIVPLFFEWALALRIDDDIVRERSFAELGQLPAATFSEILRSVDPLANPGQDLIHGLNISDGQKMFTDSARHADEFGIRVQYRALLVAAQDIIELRRSSGPPLLVQDYVSAIRIAGAASDHQAAIKFFGAMSVDGIGDQRNTETWVEFRKALHILDPVYYQFDRARVAPTPRSQLVDQSRYHPYHGRIRPRVRWHLEDIRRDRNYFMRTPHGRNPNRPDRVVSWRAQRAWLLRRLWSRHKYTPVVMNEELMCVSLIAFGRAQAFQLMDEFVWQQGHGIFHVVDSWTGRVSISGGREFDDGHVRKPTVRTLEAIVEAYGPTTNLKAGIRILLHVSAFYGIPIPHRVWSNALQWAYVTSAGILGRTRPLMRLGPAHLVHEGDVVELFNLMTERFGVEPSFEDYCVYVKSIMKMGQLEAAQTVLREKMVPYYRQIETEHHKLVEDELMRGVTELSHPRLQIEAKKEHVWYQIQTCFTFLLKEGYRNRRLREEFGIITIPNIIAEHGEFLNHQVKYQVASGEVLLLRPGMPLRAVRSIERRRTIKMTKEKPYWDWRPRGTYMPRQKVKTIEQFGRIAVPRRRARGVAADKSDKKWWDDLRRELSI